MRSFTFSVLTMLVLFSSVNSAWADVTWTGTGADTNWTTADNWGGTAPVSTDVAVIPNNETPFAVTVSDGSVANTVTANNAVLTHAAGTATFGTSLTLDAGANYALSGGTLYTPTINVNNGTFTFSSGTLKTNDSTAAVAIVLGENGTFAANPIGNANANYTYTGSGTLALTMNNRTNNTISGTFTGFSGTVEVSKGSLASSRFNSGESAVSASLKNNANVTIDLASGTQLMGGTFATNLNIAGTGYIEQNGKYFGVLRGVTCSGVVTLTGNATIGGSTNLSNTVTSNGAYTLTLGGNYSADTITISGQIKDGTSGALALTLQNLQACTATLSNANNTYSGGTNIPTGSTLEARSFASLGSGSVQNNGTLKYNITDSGTVSQAIYGTGAFTKTGTGTLTLSGANTYTGTTTISGGTLDLSTGSIYTGVNSSSTSLTINNGAKLIAKNLAWNGSLGQLSDSTGIVLNNGTIEITETGSTAKKITLNDNGTFNVKENLTLTIQSTNANNRITGSGEFIKTGEGTLKITSSNNNNTGNTTVSAGTLDLSQGVIYGSLRASRQVTIGGGVDSPATLIIAGFGWDENNSSLGTLNYNQNNFVLNNGTVQTTINAETGRSITLGAGGGTFNVVDGTTLTLSNTTYKITGSGTLTKTGEGTLKIASTNNDFTGNLIVNEGIVQFLNPQSISTNTFLLNGGTVEISGGNFRSVTTVQVTEANKTGTIKGVGAENANEWNLNGQTVSLSAVENSILDVQTTIWNGGKINVSGDGTVNISNLKWIPEEGGNTTAPTLTSTASMINLAGNIIRNQNNTVNINAGIMSPGAENGAVGILTVGNDSGNGFFNAHSTLLFDFGNTVEDGFDKLVVNGTLTLAEGSQLFLNIPDESVWLVPNGRYEFLDATNIVGDLVLANYQRYFNLVNDGAGHYYLQIDNNAVPEPSTWALLILGALGLLYFRRRR